ncbi:MAG: type III polyketide synthase [Phycisphaerales bacterium]
MKAALRSIGTATPRFGMTQQQCWSFAVDVTGCTGQKARTIRALYRLSGIERRGLTIATPEGSQNLYARAATHDGPTTAERLSRYLADASALAIESCREALARARVQPDEITHLVCCSCTGFEAPGIDQAVIRSLGLSLGVQRTMIGFMGCHAAINALRVARGLALAESNARVLVCATEVCSLHFSYAGRPDRDVANALFADGSAACVVTGVEEPPCPALELAGFSARLWPEAADEMSWRIGDHGFEMGLSQSVLDRLAAGTRDWIVPWLSGCGLSIADVGGWAIHPGGPRIVRAVRESLALDEEKVGPSLEVLRRHGNMSSPTVLFILEALARTNTPRPWVAVAFGPGLAGEAVLIE